PRRGADEGQDGAHAGQGLSPGPGARLGVPDRARGEPPRPQVGPRGRGTAVILEGIVTTLDEADRLNVAPMGPRVEPEMDQLLLRPFRTSTTYRNLKGRGEGVFHVTDD